MDRLTSFGLQMFAPTLNDQGKFLLKSHLHDGVQTTWLLIKRKMFCVLFALARGNYRQRLKMTQLGMGHGFGTWYNKFL